MNELAIGGKLLFLSIIGMVLVAGGFAGCDQAAQQQAEAVPPRFKVEFSQTKTLGLNFYVVTDEGRGGAKYLIVQDRSPQSGPDPISITPLQ